jgi:O-antigen/teichoic acid export membrane protein
MTGPRRAIKDIGLRLAAELTAALRGLFILPFVAGALGPNGYGAFAQAWVTAGLLGPLLSLAADHALVREVSSADDKTAHAESVWSALLATSITAFGVLLLVLSPLSGALGSIVYGSGAWTRETCQLAAIISIAVPITVIQGYFHGKREFGLISLFQGLRSIGGTATMAYAAVQWRTLSSILSAAILWDLCALATILWLVVKRVGFARPRLGRARQMLSYSLPIAPLSVFFLLMNAAPRYMLVHSTSLAVVGAYAAAVSVVSILGQLVSPVQYVLYPAIFGMAKRHSEREAVAILSNAVVMYGIIGLTIVAGLVAVGQPLLSVLTRGTIHTTPMVLVLVGAASIASGAARLASIYVLAFGRSRTLLRYQCYGAAVSTIAAIALVPHWVATGAACAFFLGQATLLGTVTNSMSKTVLPTIMKQQAAVILRFLAASTITFCIAIFLAPANGSHRIAIWTAMPVTFLAITLPLGGARQVLALATSLTKGAEGLPQ